MIFSEITLTLIYAVYVVGNVAALLLFGQLSDQAGRKRAAHAGLAFAATGSLLFLFARSTVWLFGGRLLFGLVAAGVIVLARRLRPTVAMTIGLLALIPAVALVVSAQAAGSMPLLVVATAVGGVTLALGYRGSLQVANDIAPDDRRADVVSSYQRDGAAFGHAFFSRADDGHALELRT